MYANPNCDIIIRHAQICHNHQTCEGHKNTMRKMGVLQLALQLTVYMVQFITTQLQLCWNNSFSTTMQFHYNYSFNIMLTLLICIHQLNLTHGTMKIFGFKIIFFLRYWSPSFIMTIDDGSRLWHVAQIFLPHGILIEFWNIYINN
jgi:hypothetical protein